ncbi:hypothetical protein [Fibrisoma montanum]|nr:hypothetical protein [Fibrisoma montanum]
MKQAQQQAGAMKQGGKAHETHLDAPGRTPTASRRKRTGRWLPGRIH